MFCARHIYKPLLKRGVPKIIANQIVFGISALAHEYLVVAPLKIGWTGLVFSAFILQTPLSMVTNYFEVRVLLLHPADLEIRDESELGKLRFLDYFLLHWTTCKKPAASVIP